MEKLKQLIAQKIQESSDPFATLNELKEIIFSLSPENVNPVDRVLWVPKEMVVANNYNPNSVAQKEMRLLYTSVREDGYTQPIVTIWDEALQKYVIVDGFHRNLILRRYKDIDERCSGRLPIVVIDKDINQRMASTVRHNRARGSHSVDGMTNILYSMMQKGMSERAICEELGMEQREFVKLKYITGFAKIFKNYEYSKAADVTIDISKEIRKAKDKKDENPD